MSRIKRAAETQQRSLPVIGKIKIGEKVKKGDKEYPTSLDYFKADGKYASMFDALFTKPTRLPIVFFGENIDEICNERFECWDGSGKRLAYGDGETFSLFNPSSKEYDIKVGKEEAIAKTKGEKNKWNTVLTIRFLIPEIKGVMGLWELTTKGAKSSVGNIVTTFDNVRAQAGRISGIPFDLLVEKHTSRKPDSTSRYPVITLVPNLSQESMLRLHDFSQSGTFDRVGVLSDATVLQLTQGAKQPAIEAYTEAEVIIEERLTWYCKDEFVDGRCNQQCDECKKAKQ